jgi:hypothetical protein
MIRTNGFVQMFTVGGVGGSGAGAHLDFHLDTHQLVKETDYGKQEAAKQESKDSGRAISTDKNGHTHIYEGGNELASNDRSGYGSSSCSYDSYDRSEPT